MCRLMKRNENLITILCLCSFLFSQTNHNDSLIQVSGNDSQWYSYEGKLWIESKFTNFSDKDIIDFKYEIISTIKIII